MSLLLDGLRILLLEDEFLIAMDVEELCRDNGASEVTIMRSLAEVDQQSSAIQFDVAIIDLMLAGESTLEFARDLYDRKVPFVFASGYSETVEIDTQFPGVAMVDKPYSGADLIESVAASYGRPAPSVQVVGGDAIT